MSITTVLALVSLILLFIPFKNNDVRLAVAVFALIIAVTNLYNNLSDQPKEELYAQRIEIIEKAEHSTDPDVIKMAEQVRADIAKEQADATQNSLQSALVSYDAQPTWIKISIPLLFLLTVAGFAFMLYKLQFAMLTNRL